MLVIFLIINLFNKIVCTTEQLLIRKLLQYYEPSVRPVINAQAVVTISFRMEITQLFELVKLNKMCGFFCLNKFSFF